MKNKIWEFLIPDEKEKKELWDNCIFVFDTNVLLNLYRYTTKTREALLTAIKGLNNRVWLPYQVAYEYAKNRVDVIYDVTKSYENFNNGKEKLIQQLAGELKIKTTDESISELSSLIDTWILEQKKNNLVVTTASNDQILNTLLSIFEGKVGDDFTDEIKQKIYDEGKTRYEKLIPPGFCDAKKTDGSDDNNKYGDLIIWKQIIEYAAHEKKNIIFITQDQKEDWWQKSKGRTIGPRVELKKEFFNHTKQKFYIYSVESFLEYSNEDTGNIADEEIITEINSIGNILLRVAEQKMILEKKAALIEKEKDLLAIKSSLEDDLLSCRNHIVHLNHLCENSEITRTMIKDQFDAYHNEYEMLKKIEQLDAALQKINDAKENIDIQLQSF